MALLRDTAIFILMVFGLIGWVIVGALVLVLSPFVIVMLLLGAVVFAPDMEGY